LRYFFILLNTTPLFWH